MNADFNALPSDWPACVQIACTTRTGGVSMPPWDSLNLGEHVGDTPAAVQANRARWQATLGTSSQPVHPVFLQQLHGTAVQLLHSNSPDGMPADACTTTETGVACTVLVADCLPVLLTNRCGTRVAAAHAGWRGLAAGVLEVTLAVFEEAPRDIFAWLGPCIGPVAFEVGADVRAAFCGRSAAVHFQARADGKYRADLAALARQRLHAAAIGLVCGNDSTPAWCTAGNPSRFFSHRRDSVRFNTTGRMAAAIWRLG